MLRNFIGGDGGNTIYGGSAGGNTITGGAGDPLKPREIGGIYLQSHWGNNVEFKDVNVQKLETTSGTKPTGWEP